MSQPDFGIGETINSLILDVRRGFARYHALPPLKKARFRAGTGAGLIIFTVYAALGRTGDVFVGWWPPLIWIAVLGFGLLWLVVGVNGARSTRDAMSAFWSIVATAIFGGLTFVGMQSFDFRDEASFYIGDLFVAALIASLVRLWLAVRGMPSASLDEVRAQQAHGQARDATAAETTARLGSTEARPQRRFQD